MRIGVPKELQLNERRVAASPKSVEQLIKLGFEILVEHDAGFKSSYEDSAYEKVGAQIGSVEDVYQSDIILKVNAPELEEVGQFRPGMTLISFIWPAQNPELMQALAAQKITVMAMDAVPRISRAQSLDALSSMANIGGYRAVIEAANEFGSFFTGQITAAGKVPPAKVLIIGAGVAGLAAIGTAHSLGAIVRAFDTRPEVKEQVESMGASFLDLKFEEEGSTGTGYAKVMSDEFNRKASEMYAEQCKEVDIIVTTALIPGRQAPRLITKEMIATMKPGSVLVDMAAGTGGNCEGSVADELVVTDNQVKIIGYTDLAGRLPTQASQLYATNLVNLLKLLAKEKDGNINVDFEDVVIRGVTVIRDGEITWPAPPIQVSAQPQAQAKAVTPSAKKEEKPAGPAKKYGPMVIIALLFLWMSSVVPAAFLAHFTVFVLACVVGYYVVWNVSHALHTPLMAVTNGISGIIIVGALLQVGAESTAVKVMAFIAILVASINIFGGFKVTQRMLAMFKRG